MSEPRQFANVVAGVIKIKRAATTMMTMMMMMTTAVYPTGFWLGGRDSNPDSQIQSLESYHWTTSQQRNRIYVSQPIKSTGHYWRCLIGARRVLPRPSGGTPGPTFQTPPVLNRTCLHLQCLSRA